jgi:hypothetical protein
MPSAFDGCADAPLRCLNGASLPAPWIPLKICKSHAVVRPENFVAAYGHVSSRAFHDDCRNALLEVPFGSVRLRWD